MNKSHPSFLLSVIVPVYNTAPYLARCLDSIINQSIKNIEIIICDDLSTDGSEKIIQAYTGKFDFIKSFTMQSKGLAGGARNLGLIHATGKYVGFVDSDDWVDTMMYQKMTELLERSSAEIAVCGVMKEYETLYEATMRYDYKIENVLEGKLALELLTRRYNQDISISSIVCNKLYNAKFLKTNNVQFLSDSLNEDDAFNFLCFLNADKVAITPNTYYHYYQRKNSVTHYFSKKHIDDFIFAFAGIKKYLDSRNAFEMHKGNYYAFFEKCLAFILGILDHAEPGIEIQNKYLKYLFMKSPEALNLHEYVDYIGTQRLRKFLTPSL